MASPILLGCQDLAKSYGARALFGGLSFALNEGDHVGLVGPNGAGKSTLLRILAGVEEPDSGACARRKSLRIAFVPQHPAFPAGRTVEEIVASSAAAEPGPDPDDLDRRVGAALSKCGFAEAKAPADALSGGWRTRLAIAGAIVAAPEIVLLDEPTNHLDVASRLWLESLLEDGAPAFVVASHDRYLLQRLARRMIDLDRAYEGGLLSVEGSYADLLEARDAVLSRQASYQESLANLVRREIAWLRRGAKARTSKSKSRIRSAERGIEELEAGRERGVVASAGIDLASSGRRTRRLWSCRGVSKRLGGAVLLDGLDLLLTPGMRLGVLGANGSGKTTLLRLIVGELTPDAGEIRRADDLRVVYFDQDRRSLDPEATLRRSLAPEGDTVVYRDRPVHVAGWAKRFLFRPEQLETPVSRLSGGERARVVLARLMLRPADLLVLDEPTNDLDIPTLEVLEESLLEFTGALVLVTHDRYLIDRVSTEILALDGRGGAERYAGYRQWEARRGAAEPKGGDRPRAESRREAPPRTGRLPYLEQREWDGMEERVLAAEARMEQARLRSEDPSIATDAAALAARLAELDGAKREVDRLYERWAELERKRAEPGPGRDVSPSRSASSARPDRD